MRRPISFWACRRSFTTPGPEVRGRVAEWRDGFFVLDKWQISRKLTLNYGLRYELPTVAYTINGNATELNPDQTALVGGTPGFHFINPNHKDWAPRLGFAYRINDKTVFRGGRRHLLQPEPDQQLHVPEHQSAVHHDSELHLVGWARRRSDFVATRSLAGRLPDGAPRPAPSSPIRGTSRTARMNQWSAGLERQLWNGGGLELQYLGSHSYHLDRSFYNNTPLCPDRAPSTRAGRIRCSARSAPSTTTRSPTTRA